MQPGHARLDSQLQCFPGVVEGAVTGAPSEACQHPHAPVAHDDTLPTILEDAGTQAIAFSDLTSNDAAGPVTATDEGTQTLTVSGVSNAHGGTVTITGGHVAFTPGAVEVGIGGECHMPTSTAPHRSTTR